MNRALLFFEIAPYEFTETPPAAYRIAGIVARYLARLCSSLKVALKNLPPGQESVAAATGTCPSPFLIWFSASFQEPAECEDLGELRDLDGAGHRKALPRDNF